MFTEAATRGFEVFFSARAGTASAFRRKTGKVKENRKTQTTCLGPGQKCTCSTDNHQILLRWEPLYVYVDIELESVASSINVIIHQNQVYYQRHSYVKPYLTDKRQRKDRENMRCIQISIYMVTERGACPCTLADGCLDKGGKVKVQKTVQNGSARGRARGRREPRRRPSLRFHAAEA